MKATRGTDVEIERRCGMVTGASCGNVTLTCSSQPRPARNDWRSRPAPNVRRYANAHGTRRNTTESAATHCKAYGVA